ncbi:MAG: hypothetical protein A3H52_02575 [Candidatus Zambryskibacteria bacterium RIFCSPLOWO2_02_FULL_39_26]|uniref:DUF2914 domain-containing protein n=1 Tax=Candidatus Zambryskibacteria bacterium RIFCSPLOWO2_12_FULL_39_23 TaxID=1802776 RepID=A0A1G2UT87_9BACT|nr:MAG: hypothetical protein A3E59_00820 [Candidatus Zambryskibacteria bacterium RIFCSPHIGHO2_12_FULL_39_47]OHB09516.1 MAG: hypothetical protein A3H52_02575 [Candidatus Zambryskibacteria bacterium RIFCSPLOWO2_02_FULL_39_26]OHB12522.1 MAG: hypothetical protein A3G99_01720 [Candidatus Zambryskibacteria bacterium RIFCSPLOWO2_12_FULL_39_23]
MAILSKIKSRINPKKVTTWYGKFERPISSLSLIGGFVFDALTLKRVDMFWENLWILGHIIVVGVCIILVHSIENEPGDETNPEKTHFWLVNILQFFFGGLLSVFLVFYFRSAELSSSWPFILLLGLAFWANESLKRHYVRATFQLSLFFLSLFSFLIYLVPVVIRRMGGGVFVLAGFLSLAIMLGYLHIFANFSGEKFYKHNKMVSFSILGIYLAINIFYFANLIPPIPISLKDSGVYHLIERNEQGYIGQYENIGWKSYFKIYTNFHVYGESSVYIYSAIFSPTGLNLTIIHEWQYFNPNVNSWEDFDKISLPVFGGRDGGFRTFSIKNNLSSGKWRVNVLTEGGQVIGRLRFNIIRSAVLPTLETKVLE